MTLLDVRDLTIEYQTNTGRLRAVDDVSFSLEEGETLGIVGESGCGKSTVAKSVLRLLGDNGHVVNGEVEYRNVDVNTLSRSELNETRWEELSMIPQNAMSALDPVYRVESTFREVFAVHRNMGKREARERTLDLLEAVDLDSSVLRDYPHELSGGQRQRVIIALALALDPAVVVADECTTGLDVVVQDAILDLLADLQAERGNAMIFITHDISAVTEIADRVAVMYAGQIVEVGSVRDVFKNATHPYTMGLRQSFPSIGKSDQRLVSISGAPPDLHVPPSGCRFAERCPFATDECREEPPLVEASSEHLARCHYIDQREEFDARASNPETWGGEEL